MPDLLLELFSEEIPARMQAKAADDLKKMVTDRLVDAGLVYEGARAFATPRRLALYRAGRAGAPAGPEGGAQRPARRRARRRDRGLPQGGGPRLDQRGLDPEGSEEGRLLHGADREAGPPRDRRDRRAACRSCCAPSRGRSRCAGARSRPSPRASNGCARCTRSSRPSAPRPRSPRSCRSRSTASRPATPPTATAS